MVTCVVACKNTVFVMYDFFMAGRGNMFSTCTAVSQSVHPFVCYQTCLLTFYVEKELPQKESKRVNDEDCFRQVALLSQRGRAMLRVCQ